MIAGDLKSLKKANKNHTQHCINFVNVSKNFGIRFVCRDFLITFQNNLLRPSVFLKKQIKHTALG